MGSFVARTLAGSGSSMTLEQYPGDHVLLKKRGCDALMTGLVSVGTKALDKLASFLLNLKENVQDFFH